MAPLPFGSTIGILGGGQLGRMTAMAAAELGYHVHIYTPEKDSPAAEVSLKTTVGEWDDKEALKDFAKSVDVVTLEFENIPYFAAETVAKHCVLYPSPDVLKVTQNRIREKTFINECGIKTAPFAPIRSALDAKEAALKIGVPSIMKTSEMGYDGKGQMTLRDAKEADSAFALLNTAEAILEGFVKFTMEISVIVARSVTGEIATFPPVHNVHKNFILHETIAPAAIAADLASKAENIAHTLADKSKLIGILAVEMFVTEDGDILVNELAPRPHNSGHWSMDGSATSQFEQVVRAITGLPLGPVTILHPTRMLNLIGEEVHEAGKILAANPSARLHLYGKKAARSGRKMGHINFLLTNNP